MPTRDELIEKLKQQLDELNAELAEVELKAKAGREKLGQTYDEQVDQLKAASRVAKQKIDEVRAAGDDRWEAVVAEAEKLRKALVHSFNYFKSQLK
jgi:LPS O-antigen subunit length determinant protein (WzzB/FepE family)